MTARLSDQHREQILAAVRTGAHPHVACMAAGLSRSFWPQIRFRARGGDEYAQQLMADVDSASAQGELSDIEATTRATEPLNEQPIVCHECGAEMQCDADQLAAMVAKLTDVAKAKGVAGELALKKLERRHPKRWSQKVIHTVQEEHERLLDVCQRVLAPEVFESLLEEYLSGEQCESEAPAGQGEQAGGGVH